MTTTEKKEWILKGESEIRCEVTEENSLILKLLSGTAEIFGVEMAVNKEYTFFDENFAVFSWYGCVIESVGKSQIYYSDSTPMISYVNTHAQLEAIRDIALANSDRGPRVMVVGPKDHGKSTTCKTLLSYAARLDRTPIFVDLDVGQGLLNIPGCISATPLEKSSLSIEVNFLTDLLLLYGKIMIDFNCQI
jgi:polyribonucleotide 5'-hydroxyl-kinase